MSLPSVTELWKHTKCGNCVLSKDGRAIPGKALGPTGSKNARIALVGESPTYGDLHNRIMLSGESGNVVRAITDQLGFIRGDLYYSSALMCNYPKGAKPKKNSLDACNGRLLWELQQLPNLKVVIALGAMAIDSLLGKSKINQEIYNVYWHESLNCFVVPTYHPGMCFVNVEAFEDIVWAFERAKSLLDKPKQHLDQPVIRSRIARSHGEALDMLHEIAMINTPTWVAIDWETDYADPMSSPTLAVGFSLRDGEAYIIPWTSNEPGPEVVDEKWDLIPTVSMIGMLHKIADNKNVKTVFHNGDFDVRVFYYNTSAMFRIDYDTMFSDYALDERGGGDELEGMGGGTKIGSHRLKSSAKRYLYVPDWEMDIKKYLKNKGTTYSHIPRPRLYQYLACDVVYTRRLRAKHEQLLLNEEPSRKGYWTPRETVHNILIPAANQIVKMEIGGIPINRDKASQVSAQYIQDLKDLEHDIKAAAIRLGWPQGEEFNQRSPDDLARLLYDIMKIPITKDLRTAISGKAIDTERPTGKDPLIKLRASHGDPIFDMLLKYKDKAKKHSTYVLRAVEDSSNDGNIHGQFALTVTRTGRLSSKNPNLQNLEVDCKEFYEPDAGCVFVNADYRQLEVRVGAILSGDKGLIKACMGDVHGEISREIFSAILRHVDNASTIDDCHRICIVNQVLAAVERRHTNKPFTNLDEFKKEIRGYLRFSAKPIVFGVMYGREAYSLANGPLQCKESEAQRYIDSFFEKFPDLHAYLEQQKNDVVEYGWVESPTGRRRRFSFTTKDFINRILKQSVNCSIQGMASDICILALINLGKGFEENGYGRLLLNCHDALGFSIHREKLDEALPWIKQTMESAWPTTNVPLAVEIKTGPNYKHLEEWKG